MTEFLEAKNSDLPDTSPSRSSSLEAESSRLYRTLRRCGDFFFKYRNAVFPLVVLLLFLAFPPRYPAGSAILDRALDTLGFLVALGGQAIRAAVIGFAYIKRGGLNKQVYAKELVTTGFFGVSRNPLYLGNALILAGVFLVHFNLLACSLGAAFFIFVYGTIILTEEHFLRGQFGEAYIRYCRNVPRLWPSFGRFGAAVRHLKFNWWRVISKDYGTCLAWTATMLALLPLEVAVNQGPESARAVAVRSVIAFLLLGSAALVIRYIKKSGRFKTFAR